MLQCRIGHVMSFLDLLLLEAFDVVKPVRGAQRQVSMMYGLLMCDVWDVHISDIN
jgi:hypothetical protein